MKVIDLLNKIGNQESVPNRILVDGKYFDWDSLEMFYQTENKEDLLELSKKYSTWDFLNFSVVEIPQMDIHTDIDIQELKEFEVGNININGWHDIENEIRYLQMGYNNLLRTAKQLDREIQELKER